MILGYLTSLIFGFILDIDSQSRLKKVSESVFPAAIQSKVALTEFNEQVRKYNEAVVLGEESYLEEAKSRAAAAHEALRNLFTFLDKDDDKRIRLLLKELTDFTAAAGTLYTRMLVDIENESLAKEALLLSRRTVELREKLRKLTDTFSNHLKSELVNVGNAHRKQQFWNMAIFFIAVLVSLILVKIIISKSVTRPLQKAAALAGAMAEGDLSRKLDIRQQDEIGGLARAMNIMAEKIESS
ncbi:MAG TPA: HAMP domain-containing protein, partial [Candidatus Deferrimicrobium sp.]|nr:HAMP domain-containing protein [Candidatus Deferrimicrobium sp.]